MTNPETAFTATQEAREREAKALGTLRSDAPQKDKMDACKELTRVGGAASVPVLAALLADEKLSHMARYALEHIPDPSADAALRNALGKLKGSLLAGVASSIGARRDSKAVEALTKLLKDTNPVVARTAALALGRIGTTAAAKAIGAALTGAPEANVPAFCEGLLRCADALPPDEAQAIYDRLRGMKNAPRQIRTAGVRGAILSRGGSGVPILLEALKSDDPGLVQGALRAAMELPAAAAKALSNALQSLPAEKRELLNQALKD